MKVFNDNGLLNPGFFEYKLDEIETIFVKEFKESQTRKIIYDGFITWLKYLLNICIPEEIWIDGSFATSKVNPNDIDLVYFVDYEDFKRNAFQISQLRQIGLNNNCDTYYSFSPSAVLPIELQNDFTNKRNYWRGQFGFDREDNPKGMIKITSKNLEMFIKEGIKDV